MVMPQLIGRARRWAARLGLGTVTALGWTVLAGSAVAWLVGARLGWIELVLAGVTGLLTFVLCGLFAIGRTTLRVGIESEPRRIVVGSDAAVHVTVTNVAKRRLRPLTLDVGGAPEPFDLPGIAGHGGVHQVSFPVPGRHRGVVLVGPARTTRGDPLGLLQRRVAWTGSIPVFVHPTTIRLAPFGSGLLRDLEGRPTKELSMSDLAFHTLREYAPGDDRRYIHWRSSAKLASTGQGSRFLVRQFQDTRRTQLLVVVDGDPDAYADPADFETAISVGASVAVQAVDDELTVSLQVADQFTRKEVGRRQTRQQVLDACARADHTRIRLPELVARASRQSPEATFALVVTGAYPSFANLRRAALQIPRQVRRAAIRVDPTGRAGVASGATFSVLTLADLRDLRTLLRRSGTA
jgi:uncharacterized protein (DUF58 family)